MLKNSKHTIKVAFVRGSHMNAFEGQNYMMGGEVKLTGISSKYPIESEMPFPTIRLLSVADLERIPIIGNTAYFETNLKRVMNRLIGDKQILFGLEKLASQFDIFHTADPHYYYSYQLARLRKEGKIKRLVSTSWETIPFNNESVDQKKKIKYETMEQIDQYICYTKRAAKCLIDEGVEKKRIAVFPIGVDITLFKPKQPDRLPKKRNPIVLFVGRLVEEKGILDLYEVVRKNMFSNVKLRIIGNGPLQPMLKELIRENRLEGAVSVEEKSYSAMPEVYREADIFVLPSKTTKTWEEQYGMVLIEAMASGLPVVAYKSGAIPEVVGKAGMLVKEGNKEELARGLKKILDDRIYRQELGTMGRERAEKYFDSKKTAHLLQKIYLS